MTTQTRLEDTNLAALISSKILHDLAGQIGAINNGLELLEEENDEDTRYYALELISEQRKSSLGATGFSPAGLWRLVEPWRGCPAGPCRAGGTPLYRERQAAAALAGQLAGHGQGECEDAARRPVGRAHVAARGRRFLCGDPGERFQKARARTLQAGHRLPWQVGADLGRRGGDFRGERGEGGRYQACGGLLRFAPCGSGPL